MFVKIRLSLLKLKKTNRRSDSNPDTSTPVRPVEVEHPPRLWSLQTGKLITSARSSFDQETDACTAPSFRCC